MQLVEMFLQKAFPTRKCNVGLTKMIITKHAYKKQKKIWIQFVAYINVIWIYLIVNFIPMLKIYSYW
jgi:hypothetical protein